MIPPLLAGVCVRRVCAWGAVGAPAWVLRRGCFGVDLGGATRGCASVGVPLSVARSP